MCAIGHSSRAVEWIAQTGAKERLCSRTDVDDLSLYDDINPDHLEFVRPICKQE